jgi:hypothetical protein
MVIVSLGTVALAVALAFLFARLASSAGRPPIDPESWKYFSADRYRPLTRLLDPVDIEFLRAQPGYQPGLERELAGIRRRAVLALVGEMRQDFDALIGFGQAWLQTGQADDLFRDQLFERKLRFSRAFLMLRFQLLGWRFGVCRVDVRPLVETLRSAEGLLRPMLWAPQAA